MSTSGASPSRRRFLWQAVAAPFALFAGGVSKALAAAPARLSGGGPASRPEEIAFTDGSRIL